MRRLLSSCCIFLGLFVAVAISWQDSESFCVIFPENGRDIWGVAQRNIIIFGDDEVSLIPQVNFEGDARDFGILVPVPKQPQLSTAGANMFREASFMTQPLTRRGSTGCGCDDDNADAFPLLARANFGGEAMIDTDESGVTVVYEQLVGTFQAVVLQATNADDLTAWLNENNYKYDQNDSDILADYVAQNWYFVAMKLDTAQVPPFINQWWNATTSPAKITFDHSADKLTYPLKISAISTNERSDVLIYTSGKDPMRFPGANVEYANEIDDEELRAMNANYPQFSTLLTSGAFVTKLRRTFAKDEMKQDIEITKSDDRREFREIRYTQDNGGFIFAGIGLMAFGIFLRRRPRSQC